MSVPFFETAALAAQGYFTFRIWICTHPYFRTGMIPLTSVVK
jgi:hypothetical protein